MDCKNQRRLEIAQCASEPVINSPSFSKRCPLFEGFFVHRVCRVLQGQSSTENSDIVGRPADLGSRQRHGQLVQILVRAKQGLVWPWK